MKQRMVDKAGKVAGKMGERMAKKILSRVPEEKRPAKVVQSIRMMMRMVGANEMRRLMISGIEKDFEEKLAKDPSISEGDLIGEYVNTPEYVSLLKDLGLGEEHLRVMAKEAMEGKVGS